MPSISCVYCGGSHASADEVRACWQRSEGTQVAPVRPDDALLFDEPPALPLVEPADEWAEGSPTLTVAVHRGPAELGRNVIVSPGQPAPADWADAPRVVVGAGPSPLTQLRSLAATRTSVVIEVHGDLVVTAESCTQPPHQVGPRHEFVDDAIAHLCVSNAFDLRSEIPRWPLVERAIQLGARSVSDGRGDVQLPTGELAWLDGGPPRFTEPIDGMPVLHRVAIEHGSLQPPVGNTTAAELAPDQLEAVTHDGGAARIIAPAGSGKTRVLTERARHLVQQWRIPPTAVCLVAFNKRAQEEIQARTTDVPGLHVRTLNAIALAIINGAPPFARQPARLATIDEGQVRKLIQQMVRFPRKRNSDPVATWIEALSMARLGLLDPATVEARYDGEVEGFAEVFPRYRTTLARAGQVDFDEQVQRAIELLLTDPAARATAQRACRFMLVDEFQDLTPAHLLLVRLLAGPDGAVFAVGDDDQTIYGYNGADPAWLIDFATLFPGAGEHPLEVNYRCPAGVVRAADTLLRHNRRRVPKTIRAGATDPHDGFLVAPAGADSVDTTVQAIHTAIAAGHQPTDIAVLTRVNSLLAPVQVALRVDGVPVSGGVGSEFVDRTAVRAGLAWLRVAASSGQLDSADVAEAFRRPARSVHPRIADWVGEQRSVADIRRLAQRLQNERDTQQVVGFALDIERMQRLASTGGSTAAILDALRNQMGLARTIASLDTHRRGMNRAAQNDDLTALAQLATLHPVPASFEG
ncbi:MAG TPA: hypothetical protein DCR14_16445, partial [Acidimicrobiaceae bacterium]|nr:hypothetical protein [Acidimicrobiaceae bacterium]